MSEVTIRDAMLSDAGSIAVVHVESWKTTYDGLMPAEVIAERTVERRTQQWTNALSQGNPARRLFVAEADGRIVAYAQFGPNRSPELAFTHELFAIYALQEFQRRGIGKKLMREGVRWLVEQGAQSMVLWVLADNAIGRRFYHRIGGVIAGERFEDIGTARVKEYAYGWTDLDALSETLGR